MSSADADLLCGFHGCVRHKNHSGWHSSGTYRKRRSDEYFEGIQHSKKPKPADGTPETIVPDPPTPTTTDVMPHVSMDMLAARVIQNNKPAETNGVRILAPTPSEAALIAAVRARAEDDYTIIIRVLEIETEELVKKIDERVKVLENDAELRNLRDRQEHVKTQLQKVRSEKQERELRDAVLYVSSSNDR